MAVEAKKPEPITTTRGYAGADWLRECKKPVGEFGAKAADLIGWWVQGLYHIHKAALKADWTNESYIRLVVRCNGWATFDFRELTRLVVAAHDMCIRVEMTPVAPSLMEILLHPRQREGSNSRRHPTMEEAIDRARSE